MLRFDFFHFFYYDVFRQVKEAASPASRHGTESEAVLAER